MQTSRMQHRWASICLLYAQVTSPVLWRPRGRNSYSPGIFEPLCTFNMSEPSRVRVGFFVCKYPRGIIYELCLRLPELPFAKATGTSTTFDPDLCCSLQACTIFTHCRLLDQLFPTLCVMMPYKVQQGQLLLCRSALHEQLIMLRILL